MPNAKENLKWVCGEQLKLQEQNGKIKPKYLENKEVLELLQQKLKENEEMQITIQKLQKQNQELEANSKADQKRIRMLVKNNKKKRKLLDSQAIAVGWEHYALCETEDDEGQKRYEELEACWMSSDESADELDNK